MMRDLALPAVERGRLIERMADAEREVDMRDCASAREYGTRMAQGLLATIEEQYVLIPRDQVTGLTDRQWAASICCGSDPATCDRYGSGCPMLKHQKDPTTTKEQ